MSKKNNKVVKPVASVKVMGPRWARALFGLSPVVVALLGVASAESPVFTGDFNTPVVRILLSTLAALAWTRSAKIAIPMLMAVLVGAFAAIDDVSMVSEFGVWAFFAVCGYRIYSELVFDKKQKPLRSYRPAEYRPNNIHGVPGEYASGVKLSRGHRDDRAERLVGNALLKIAQRYPHVEVFHGIKRNPHQMSVESPVVPSVVCIGQHLFWVNSVWGDSGDYRMSASKKEKSFICTGRVSNDEDKCKRFLGKREVNHYELYRGSRPHGRRSMDDLGNMEHLWRKEIQRSLRVARLSMVTVVVNEKPDSVTIHPHSCDGLYNLEGFVEMVLSHAERVGPYSRVSSFVEGFVAGRPSRYCNPDS